VAAAASAHSHRTIQIRMVHPKKGSVPFSLRPDQSNRAFDVLKSKFYCEGGRESAGEGYEGVGLKRFPKSEKPR